MLPIVTLNPSETLPADGYAGTLAGRVWRPDVEGPSVVAIRADGVFDVTTSFPTMRDLCETRDPAASLKATAGERIGTLANILTNTPPEQRDPAKPWLLAPVDLQAIKAAGVTFAISMIERVIEERARGNPQAADGIRRDILRIAGIGDLKQLRPGSKEAATLKEAADRARYVEPVSRGRHRAGCGDFLEGAADGRRRHRYGCGASPDVDLEQSGAGSRARGRLRRPHRRRYLGNDVNLRDVEGRSALLLSKAKDNNASCAIGPFLRFFDATFSLDEVCETTVSAQRRRAGRLSPRRRVLHE